MRLRRYFKAVQERSTGASDDEVAYAVELLEDRHKCDLEAAHRLNLETGEYVRFPEYPQAERDELERRLRELPPESVETRYMRAMAETLENREREDESRPSASNDRPGIKRKPGPEPTFHDGADIGTALAALSDGVESASRSSGLNKKDVLRGEQLQRWGFLRWDYATLWADPERVWQRDGKVALRLLVKGAEGLEWVDPLELKKKPEPLELKPKR
jgi:hypothetical protein